MNGRNRLCELADQEIHELKRSALRKFEDSTSTFRPAHEQVRKLETVEVLMRRLRYALLLRSRITAMSEPTDYLNIIGIASGADNLPEDFS